MKILITGAGGFIGSHLVDSQLEQGQDVRGVDLHLNSLAHHSSHPHLEVLQGDITEKGLLQKLVEDIDLVYHLASAHLDVSLSDEDYKRVNVDATLSLLEAARQAGVKRFVHCSSVGVIGDVKNPPADETTVCRPLNIYERTKHQGERVALEYSHQTGFPVVVVRPSWVYGPRCPRTRKLMRMISENRFIFFGKGQNLRHPVYISDAVKGLELAASVDGVNGEIFIIADHMPVQVSELVEVMSTALGAHSPWLHLPISLGLMGGYMVEMIFKLLGKGPPFSRRSVDFFLKSNAYDISKAMHMLGYQPQVNLQEGVQKTIQWIHEMEERS
jgi:nucleoside-diphosphate-sugar epimerase